MKPVRILVADDHEVVRQGLRALLESQPGWSVVGEARNGREAVEWTRQLKPDVVVLDVSMPELNGLEATRRILGECPGTEVLILTMHASEQIIREVLKAGARGYVLKSDASRNLTSAVAALSQHKPFLTADVSEMVLQEYLNPNLRPDRNGLVQDRLTPREREIVQLVAEGKTNKEVAAQLGISVKTAETHRINIMHKLDLRSLSDLVRYAVRNGIIEA